MIIDGDEIVRKDLERYTSLENDIRNITVYWSKRLNYTSFQGILIDVIAVPRQKDVDRGRTLRKTLVLDLSKGVEEAIKNVFYELNPLITNYDVRIY